MKAETGEYQHAIHLEVDGTLDLHAFRPADLKFLIPDYIEECRQRNILHLRIIHGKGKGILKRTVHSILSKHPEVIRYHLADESGGSWGATLVTLQAKRP